MNRFSVILIIILFGVEVLLLVSESFGQDAATLNLPDGATLRLGKGTIHDIGYSPDSSWFWVASSIGIWLYDAESYETLGLLTDHRNSCSVVALSPDGELFAIGGNSDDTILLWDADTGEERLTLRGHIYRVSSVAFHPNGQFLASGSFEMVRLWHTQTGAHLHTFNKHIGDVTSVAFSPTGEHLVSSCSVANGTQIFLWQVNTVEHLHTFTLYGDLTLQLAFHSDGKTIARSGLHNDLTLFDRTKDKSLHAPNGVRFLGFAFCPDEKTIVGGSRDGTIHIWDIQTGEHIGILRARHQDPVGDIVFRPDGKMLASATLTEVRLWDIKRDFRDEVIGVLDKDRAEPISVLGYTSNITSVVFRPDGKTVASKSGWTTQIWDVNTGALLSILETETEQGIPLARSTAANRVVVADNNNDTLRLLDATEKNLICTLRTKSSYHSPHIYSVAFSLDGQLLVSGSEIEDEISLWDAQTGEFIHKLTGGQRFKTLVFHPTGKQIAGISQGKTICLWDTKTGEQKHVFTKHSAEVTCLAFSPNGQLLVSGSVDLTIRFWDTETGENVRTLHGHKSAVTSFAFSPDAELLASGSSNGTIRFWQLNTSMELRRYKFSGHTRYINSVAFSPDAKLLATGSTDGTVLLWDLTLLTE